MHITGERCKAERARGKCEGEQGCTHSSFARRRTPPPLPPSPRIPEVICPHSWIHITLFSPLNREWLVWAARAQIVWMGSVRSLRAMRAPRTSDALKSSGSELSVLDISKAAYMDETYRARSISHPMKSAGQCVCCKPVCARNLTES